MTVFAILADSPNAELGTRIKELFPTEFYQLSDTEWLIAAETTANALSDQVGLKDGRYGRAIVIQTKGTGAGWHGKATWEWLRTKAG